MKKTRHCNGKIWPTFVTVLWRSKTEITRRDRDIGSSKSLVRYDFQNLLTILAYFVQKCTWKQLQLNSYWNDVEKKIVHFFENSANGKVKEGFIFDIGTDNHQIIVQRNLGTDFVCTYAY